MFTVDVHGDDHRFCCLHKSRPFGALGPKTFRLGKACGLKADDAYFFGLTRFIVHHLPEKGVILLELGPHGEGGLARAAQPLDDAILRASCMIRNEAVRLAPVPDKVRIRFLYAPPK